MYKVLFQDMFWTVHPSDMRGWVTLKAQLVVEDGLPCDMQLEIPKYLLDRAS